MSTSAKKIETNKNGVTWFEINGTDYGTGFTFENEIVGVTIDGKIVDCDGCPLTDGDIFHTAITNALEL